MPDIELTRALIGRDLNEHQFPVVGEENPDATVLVLDSFERSTDSASHGEMVKSVLLQRGVPSDSIRSVEADTDISWQHSLSAAGPESSSERLDAYIEFDAGLMLETTRRAIEQHCGPESSIRTVNLSRGTSGVQVAQFLLNTSIKLNEDMEPQLSEKGQWLTEALGPFADTADFEQKVIDRVDKVMSKSDFVKMQKDMLNLTLLEFDSRGGSVYVAAGNDQGYIDRVRTEGLKIPDRMGESVLSLPTTRSVGALDTKGTTDPGDDEVAKFSNKDRNVMFLAPGVDVELAVGGETTTASGTSLSTPYAVAAHEKKRQENPNYSGSMVSHLLQADCEASCPNSPIAVIL